MEADFSVRKEIESVRPPHADPESSYSAHANDFLNDDTIRLVGSGPPQPAQRRPTPPWSEFIVDDDKFWKQQYLKIVDYQQKLLLEQQKYNHHLLEKLIEFRASRIWRYALIATVIVLIYIILQNREKIRLFRNPFSRDERFHDLNDQR